MVFFRRRGLHEKQKPTWKKYSIAYSGTRTKTTITSATYGSYSAAQGASSTVNYYTALSFAEDGTASAVDHNTVSVSYMSYTNADVMNGKILRIYQMYYYVLNEAATRSYTNDDFANEATCKTYKYTNGGFALATARSLAIAGDYIEDVESEDPNAYPDNGPLGLYFYIKQ